jgi:hypothetical protein
LDDEQAPDPLAGALLLRGPEQKSSVWADDEDLRPRFAAGAHSISTLESGPVTTQRVDARAPLGGAELACAGAGAGFGSGAP